MPQPEWIPCPDQRKCAAQCRLARILIIINSGPMYLYYTPTQTQTHYYTLYNLNDRAPVLGGVRDGERLHNPLGARGGAWDVRGRVRGLRAACDGSTRGRATHRATRAETRDGNTKRHMPLKRTPPPRPGRVIFVVECDVCQRVCVVCGVICVRRRGWKCEVCVFACPSRWIMCCNTPKTCKNLF